MLILLLSHSLPQIDVTKQTNNVHFKYKVVSRAAEILADFQTQYEVWACTHYTDESPQSPL